MDKVSIVIPAYNCEKTIERAINSALNQTYNNLEVIVVNDGSTDKTKEICEKIKDSKLKFYTKVNGGPSSARNFAIKKATGSFIMFLDADDYYMGDAVYNMVTLIKENNYDIVTANYISFDDEKKYKEKKYKNYQTQKNKEINKYIDLLLQKNLFNTNWNKIYKTSIIKDNKILFDESKEIGEDIRFNFDYMKFVTKCLLTNKTVYYYNISSDGLTKKNQSTKAIRYLNLMEYQQNYYKENGFSTKKLQQRIFKCFFNIVELKDEKILQRYLEILESTLNKKIYLKIIYYLLKNKKYKLLYLLRKVR